MQLELKPPITGCICCEDNQHTVKACCCVMRWIRCVPKLERRQFLSFIWLLKTSLLPHTVVTVPPPL